MIAQAAIDRFADAARSAGAVVTILAPGDDLHAAIGGILLQEKATRVVVSPAAAASPWLADRAVENTARAHALVRRIASQEPRIAATLPQPAGANNAGKEIAFEADAGITTAEFGLADTGTLVLVASPEQHRLDSLAPPIHIALLRAEDLVANLEELFARLVEGNAFDAHSAITFIRGPSRTADIELTLSVGVHGPKRVYVFVLSGG